MKLKEAIEQSADIIVNNDTEKADVINILLLNGECVDLDNKPPLYPHRIILYGTNMGYDISEMRVENDADYPQIPADQFIAANSLADTTTNNGITDDHGAHSTNVL